MRENRTHGSEGGESLEKALLYPYSAMDGKFKSIHGDWIPAQIRLERICINPKGVRQDSLT